MTKKVVVGVAWTYANSDIHLGHISAYISGDVLARYHRLKGDDVCMVSGTDCHGTPITERALKENTTPEKIVEHYHNQYSEVFKQLGFSYDCYTKTASPYHHEKVKEMIKTLYDKGFIYSKTEQASYCPNCKKFVYDREVEVVCPKCEGVSKGDQCDHCGYVFQTQDLLKGKCRICGSRTEIKDNTNLYFALSKLEPEMKAHFENCKDLWRKNTVNETEKFLKEGLVDRAVTRDLSWGIDVPFSGFDDKKIYVWIDAVWGYVSATMKYCEENGKDWKDFWVDKKDGSNLVYLCHGKDNIVFHTIIFPALLKAFDDKMFLPNVCVSTEFLNVNGEKMSKSKGNGLLMIDMIKKFDPDSLRMFVVANGPEKRDSNVCLDDYQALHNGEIVNKFANFVNRTLNFKGLDGFVPTGIIDQEIKDLVKQTFEKVAKNIENIGFRDAVSEIFSLVENANKFYDTQKPWLLFKEEDKTAFNNVMATCAYVIANLSVLFEPFMPFCCKKIQKHFNICAEKWQPIDFVGGKNFGVFETMFSRLSKEDFE